MFPYICLYVCKNNNNERKERTVNFRMGIIERNMERDQERTGQGKVKVESNVFLLSLKCFRNKHGSQKYSNIFETGV